MTATCMHLDLSNLVELPGWAGRAMPRIQVAAL